jgi:fructosamine-3-kinase
MTARHPLLESAVVSEIERAASAHLGRGWTSGVFTDLDDRASHPCGVLYGQPFSVFAKVSVAGDADAQFTAELNGLALLRQRGQIATPTPIATGVISLETGALLLFEALTERLPDARRREDWTAIGHTLAALHQVHDEQFGLEHLDGFFGPLPQGNCRCRRIAGPTITLSVA